MKKRADVYLHEMGYAPSRKKAQVLLQKGQVKIRLGDKSQILQKPSELVVTELVTSVEITEPEELKYVSRSGLKLERALEHLNLSVSQKMSLDVGLSTGGFSQCLLEKGASFVCGIDVGINQLHQSLKDHPQLIWQEKTDGKEPLPQELLDRVQQKTSRSSFDLLVMDVSFTPILPVMKNALQYLSPGGEVLALIKPQFEVGQERLKKGGLVSEDDGQRCVESLAGDFQGLGLSVQSYFPSGLRGEDGNQEYFIYAKKPMD